MQLNLAVRLAHALTPALASLLLVARPAAAEEFWVDPASGDTANGGSGPADAWPSITHALTQIPTAGSHTVHLATGTYSTSSGESFPIRLRRGLTISGSPDSRITPAGTAFEFMPHHNTVADPARLEGFAVIGGGTVVYFYKDQSNGGTLVLERLWAVNTGILVHGVTGAAPFVSAQVTLNEVVKIGGGRVADFTEDDCSMPFYLDAHRCRFEGTSGVYYLQNINGFLSSANFTQCEFRDIGTGFWADTDYQGAAHLTFESCLIEGPGSGVQVWSGGSDHVTFRGCTITGLEYVVRGIGASVRVTVEGSILYGNTQDMGAGASPLYISYSNVEDGSGQGGTGNLSVDPEFRDPAHGDYRLTFGSPCVDGWPTAIGADLLGQSRDVDGDLDTGGEGDMGAYELRTLLAPATLALPGKLDLDVSGEVGQYTMIYLARSEPLAVPDATTFGMRWLPAPMVENVAPRKIVADSTVRHSILVPYSPALIGQTFSFQALTRSTTSTVGGAWSGLVTVVFTD